MLRRGDDGWEVKDENRLWEHITLLVKASVSAPFTDSGSGEPGTTPKNTCFAYGCTLSSSSVLLPPRDR